MNNGTGLMQARPTAHICNMAAGSEGSVATETTADNLSKAGEGPPKTCNDMQLNNMHNTLPTPPPPWPQESVTRVGGDALALRAANFQRLPTTLRRNDTNMHMQRTIMSSMPRIRVTPPPTRRPYGTEGRPPKRRGNVDATASCGSDRNPPVQRPGTAELNDKNVAQMW